MSTPMRAACMFGILLLLPVLALADPCLIVYPDAATVYHYDVNEYYTVGPGHPLYDPLYDRGGEVLVEHGDEIAYNIYQAPQLDGFQPSQNGVEGYFIDDGLFDLIVDGFHNAPITFENVLLVFEPVPAGCGLLVLVDGMVAEYEPGLGYYRPIGDIVVSTPTGVGGNYSDTVTVEIAWGGCEGFQGWAFSDENYNLHRDGGECKTAFSHDFHVPVEQTTWGAIRSIFND